MKEIHKPRMSASMALVTDENGNVVPHPNVSTQELSALNGFIVGSGTVQTQLNSKKGYVDYSTSQYLVGSDSYAPVGTQTVTAPYDCMVAIRISHSKQSTSDSTHYANGYINIDGFYVGNISCHVTGQDEVGNQKYAGNTVFLPVKSGQTIGVDVGDATAVNIVAFKWK